MLSADWPVPGFWVALSIGVLVFGSVMVAFRRVFSTDDRVVLKSGALFAGAAGVLTTLYLLERPDILDRYALQIVLALLGLVLAFIALLRRHVR
ncbi:MAG: hypothetical protein GXY76_22720 [Chloroflexi bacterium]|nr:hypothetical protein [Chloroflexota bacterium]